MSGEQNGGSKANTSRETLLSLSLKLESQMYKQCMFIHNCCFIFFRLCVVLCRRNRLAICALLHTVPINRLMMQRKQLRRRSWVQKKIWFNMGWNCCDSMACLLHFICNSRVLLCWIYSGKGIKSSRRWTRSYGQEQWAHRSCGCTFDLASQWMRWHWGWPWFWGRGRTCACWACSWETKFQQGWQTFD